MEYAELRHRGREPAEQCHGGERVPGGVEARLLRAEAPDAGDGAPNRPAHAALRRQADLQCPATLPRADTCQAAGKKLVSLREVQSEVLKSIHSVSMLHLHLIFYPLSCHAYVRKK